MAIVHKLASILFFAIFSFSIVHSENTVRGLLRSSNISPADIYANQWALIIGINQYKDFPQLNYAVEDAKSIRFPNPKSGAAEITIGKIVQQATSLLIIRQPL